MHEIVTVNPMSTTHDPQDNELPAEIDFRGGTRGAFFRSGSTLHLPVYLDAELQTRLSLLASKRGVDLSTLVNAMLREDIDVIETPK
jgi:hypothetical protein